MTSPPPSRSGRSPDARSGAGSAAVASTGRTWLVPAALITLSAVPIAAGAARLGQFALGAEITAENARFFAMPVGVVAHIVSVSVFTVLGAFQFVPRLRRRGARWHRAAGRITVASGLVAALSGLWLTLFFPRVAGDGVLITGFRLVFGSAMALFLVLGFAAIRRRDFVRHRAWMIRGYAIGLGAGTQAMVHLIWFPFGGMAEGTTRALLIGAGWTINLVVAEWIIRRRAAWAVRGQFLTRPVS